MDDKLFYVVTIMVLRMCAKNNDVTIMLLRMCANNDITKMTLGMRTIVQCKSARNLPQANNYYDAFRV